MRWLTMGLWLALIGLSPSASLAQTVWTGPQIAFAKADFTDPFAPESQDLLAPGVAISRGDSMGIFNPLSESGFDVLVSPAGTEWAFPHNNPGATISAANYAMLVFDVWRDAHGGAAAATVGQPAVVHLVAEDVYLDLSFTSYSGGGTGGGFSYTRNTPASVPGPGVALRLVLAAGLAARARIGPRSHAVSRALDAAPRDSGVRSGG